MTAATSCCHLFHNPSLSCPTVNLQTYQQNPYLKFSKVAKQRNCQRLLKFSNFVIRAVDGDEKGYVSAWDDKPYQILPSGKKSYLDEQDVVAFLDPLRVLVPLNTVSYNPATYLWKKIEDIPEERRHRLLRLLHPRHISRAWQIAGTRYENPKLAKNIPSNLLDCADDKISLEFYNCGSNGGPLAIAWMKFFKKAIFHSRNGQTYGRLIGGSFLARITKKISPLYFMVTETREVMSTEQPCDFAYEFREGHLDLHDYPQGFPRPVEHPHPFNDQVVIYVRCVGPGLLVGQAWQEGKELQQVPRKLCGEILMVKDYAASRDNHHRV